MATRLVDGTPASAEDRFHFTLVAMMATVLVAGFSVNLTLGRSSFHVPLLWHLHAFVFFGWVVLVVAQAWLATRGPIALHRQLGWLATFWLPAMVILGTTLTVTVLRRGTAPPFFMPQHFLIANVLGLLTAAVLVMAAIILRRDTAWHRRLQICAFAALLGPGFGRLLPMPFMVPYAFELAEAAGLLFPAYAMIREKRRDEHVHPAWWVGVGSIVAVLLLSRVIGFSPLGGAIYDFAMAGSPGAAVPGLAFGRLPGM